MAEHWLAASRIRLKAMALVAGMALAVGSAMAEEPYSPAMQQGYPNNVYWGDTHIHTYLSGDAVFELGPDDAYRFARGEEVASNGGQRAKLQTPLDFVVIADHGNNMGAGDESAASANASRCL